MSDHQTCKKCSRDQRFEFNVADEMWNKLPEPWCNGVLCIECFLEELQGVVPYQKFDMLDFYHMSIVGTDSGTDDYFGGMLIDSEYAERRNRRIFLGD